MSSFDKIVKLACKPKVASPKAKYIDPIIAATWSDDGSVSDVCKALVPRIREPNVIVVFKALIVLHTMIRNGSTDNVLGYLSQTDILRLKNVAAVNWEGYAAPENLQHYALYLDCRIRAYRDLKHDAIKVQSDTNRDMRSSMAFDEEGGSSSIKNNKRGRRGRDDPPPATAPTRSKTIMGRKLRVMTVEKGLLRETRIVHGMIDALVECRFYLDDLEDELNTQALRMLVKDLLILFQAGNEGVINLLEHYFEMSHIDAEEALKIYRHFCSQTEKVVEYLGVARKLQNLLNVPIPNLKHAPVSLAGALQEYLDDPNFEDNRLEYKANMKATENSARRDKDSKNKKSSVTFKDSNQAAASTSTSPSPANGTSGGQNGQKKEVIDFFNAIEEEQQPMFQQSPPNSASLQPQFTINPFSQMMTGQQFGQTPQIALHNTGFLVPQQTAVQAPNPFNNMLGVQQPVQSQATGHRPFSAFIPSQATGVPSQQTGFPQQLQQSQSVGFLQQPQQTGFLQQPQQTGFLGPQQTGFLQPQTTGSNPFRQSMLLPQSTGSALFNSNASGATLGQNLFTQSKGGASAPNSASAFSASTSFSTFQPQAQPSISAFSSMGGHFGSGAPAMSPPLEIPNRPQSTPLASANNVQPMQQVKTHQTGTKNPFGPVTAPVPPMPKPPTLFELSMGVHGSNANSAVNPQQQQPTSAPTQTSTSMDGFNFANSVLNPGPTDMSGIASSFTSLNLNKDGSGQNPPAHPLQPQHTVTPSNASSGSSLFSSALSSQPTGATSISSNSSNTGSLTSQPTGFAGLKPFKPSSSFGASLLDSVPGSNASSPPPAKTGPSTGLQPQHTITPGSTFGTSSFGSSFLSNNASPTGALNAQPTGFSSGSSTTLNGPFGTSGFASQPTGVPGLSSNGPSNGASPLSSQPTGATRAFTPSSNFGMSLSAQATGASGPFAGSNTSAFSSQPTGTTGTSTLGVGLRPQLTGGGAANPFRASMATNSSAFGAGGAPPVPAMPSMFQTGQQQQQGQQQPFGGMQFGSSGPFAGMMGQQGQQGQQPGQQQQQPLF